MMSRRVTTSVFCSLLLFSVPTLYGQTSAVSTTPNTGVGSSQTFALVYSDPLGGSNIKGIQVSFNDDSSGQWCQFLSDFSTKSMRLYSASEWTSTSATPPQILSNSQCSVNTPAIST